MDKNDLTKGSVIKKLLIFVLPIFGANLLQAMYGTVDLIVVGYFSDASAVSAVATGSMTMQTINGIIIGLSMGCMILLGQYIGGKRYNNATKTVASTVALFLAIAFVMTIIIPFGSKGLATVMNAPEEALAQTINYIRICGLGITAIIFFNVISGLFRGIGDSKRPFILMMISCGINIIGDIILVGVFNMAASGAAIATVFAQFVSVLSALFIMKKRGIGFEFHKEDFKVTRRETGKILKYGMPIAAQEALTGISFAVIMAILNNFGLVASAGVGVAEKIVGILFLVPGALMSAVSAFTAQNIGAGLRDRAKESMRIGMLFSVITGIFMFYIGFFHGNILTGLFTKDLAVIEAASDFLRSYAIDCAIIGFNFSMMGYLNGCGKTLFVSIQGITSTFLVRIPVSFFMSRIPGVTLFQVGLATPSATVFAIIITVVYLFFYEKREKNHHDQPNFEKGSTF